MMKGVNFLMGSFEEEQDCVDSTGSAERPRTPDQRQLKVSVRWRAS